VVQEGIIKREVVGNRYHSLEPHHHHIVGEVFDQKNVRYSDALCPRSRDDPHCVRSVGHDTVAL